MTARHPYRRLPRSFYARPTLAVARDLIGRYIVHRYSKSRILIGKIVEVEAYRAADDPASHAHRGKTPRNAVMFGPPGHLYVYFTYGMHFCANVVTERTGKAGAVLLRGIEPLKGMTWMKRQRGKLRNDIDLTNGPAKFCQAFRLRRKENGIDLLQNKIYITAGDPPARRAVGRSVRIGIRNGSEKLWRFYLRDNKWVSRHNAD